MELELIKKILHANRLTALLFMLFPVVCSADKSFINSIILNDVVLEAKAGREAPSFPQLLKGEDGCVYVTSVKLHPYSQRAIGLLTKKTCLDKQSVKLHGVIAGIDGKLGQQVICNEEWKNNAGGSICLAGEVKKGHSVTIIITDTDEEASQLNKIVEQQEVIASRLISKAFCEGYMQNVNDVDEEKSIHSKLGPIMDACTILMQDAPTRSDSKT